MDYGRNIVYVTCDDGEIRAHTKFGFTGSRDGIVMICPEAAVCGLVPNDDGSVRFDENTYIVEKMKKIVEATCSPSALIAWLQVQVRAITPLITTPPE